MAEDDLDLEGGAAESSNEGGEGGGKSKMMLIIIIAAVVLLGGAAAGYFFFMGGGEKPKTPAASKDAGKGGEQKPEAPPTTQVVKMQPFVVNLADEGGKRYLKLTLNLGLKDPQMVKMVEPYLPQMRDSILLLLTSKAYADIASVAGKIRLRNEILSIINRTLGAKAGVHAVYFTEFVIQ